MFQFKFLDFETKMFAFQAKAKTMISFEFIQSVDKVGSPWTTKNETARENFSKTFYKRAMTEVRTSLTRHRAKSVTIIELATTHLPLLVCYGWA